MDEGQEPNQIPNDNTPPDNAPQPETFDPEYVKGIRSEAAKYRKELREAQKRLSEIEAAQEAAKAQELEAQGEWQKRAEQEGAKAKELQAQLEAQRLQLASERRTRIAISIAQTLGAIDPGDANFVAAVASIDIEDDGAEASIRKALETLKETRPYLFAQGKPHLASFNPSGQPQEPPGESDEEKRKRLFGTRNVPFFDAKNAAQHGGGVIWPTKSND